RQHYEIAAPSSSLTHQRTLRTTAIAATTSDGNHASLVPGIPHEVTSQGSHILERIRGVGIIHHYRERLVAIHPFESSRDTSQGFDAFGNRVGGAIPRVSGSCCCEDIYDVHMADKRRENRNASGGRYYFQFRSM